MRDAKSRNMDRTDSHNRSRRWFGKRMRGDAGQSLVELALIVPVFAVLILGAVELGQLVYAAIEVSEAARAGVAFGAQSAAASAQTAAIEQAAINDAADVTGLTATATTFCSCSNATSAPVIQVPCGTAIATCGAANASVVNYVQVNTTATITPLIHLPGIPVGYPLFGQAIMRVE